MAWKDHTPDDDLSDALKVMAQYQVRRLAVTAEDDRLVGLVIISSTRLPNLPEFRGHRREDLRAHRRLVR